MLVLSRLRDEVVVISQDGVEIGRVAVVDIRGEKVRLGLTFPTKIDVDRLEVFEANARAAAGLAVQS